MDKTLKIEAAVILFLIIIICIVPSNGLKKAAKDVDKYQHVSNVTIINNGAEEDGVLESTIIRPNRFSAGYGVYVNDNLPDNNNLNDDSEADLPGKTDNGTDD